MRPRTNRQQSEHSKLIHRLASLGRPGLLSIIALLAFIGVARGAAEFEVKFENDRITSLKPRTPDAAEFIQTNRWLGDVNLRWRAGDTNWQSTANGASVGLGVRSQFALRNNALIWTVRLQNQTDQEMEVGDLALPLPIARSGPNRSVILKHQFISGHGSFLIWMRSDLVGPHLVLLPTGDTKLEYWEGGRDAGFRVFVHSAATGAELKAYGRTWRQPHTSLALAPKGKRGDTRQYEFKFRWADNYDAIRQLLVDEGAVDVQVVPGMTVPSDLSATFALRSSQKIRSVEAEFPNATRIKSLGMRGDYRLFEARFATLGENRLTVNYGKDRRIFLEFFSTEPVETLIKKRAAFLARSQHRDPAKWYNGLITDWNMAAQKLISPEDYAPIPRARYYAVTCDDPGLGKPAFLAAKNAEFPVQSEVEALDYYVTNFVWGGLQQTTVEPYPYAVYGIPDWKTNRASADTGRNGQRHLWRVYDYPHIIQMYYAMYQVAKRQPQIRTALTAEEYLQRAYGTARAMFTVPLEIERWSAYGTGFYNELVIVELIAELEAVGLSEEAATVRGFWERKVGNFVNRRQDLFRSEYAFDTTGFESTHALAKYAVQHAANFKTTNASVTPPDARRFLEKQIAANLFCRGVLEPAYYYLGSDIRGSGGNAYTLTYMSQMGGWGVLDYALNFATNRASYLRLGYASYLSAWALVNSGTPESNYGYWFPGAANDGAAGGGFEPSANGRMWLVPAQVLGRGSWNFACETDLGYCGALRTAATILADDPIFGRICFGGNWQKHGRQFEIVPKDGLRRRFHALLDSGELSLMLDNDRFASGQSLVLAADLSGIHVQLESDNSAKHDAKLRLCSSLTGQYEVRGGHGLIANFDLRPREETVISIPVDSGRLTTSVSISRRGSTSTKQTRP